MNKKLNLIGLYKYLYALPNKITEFNQMDFEISNKYLNFRIVI